jgi:large subunit ribosomal protein L21
MVDNGSDTTIGDPLIKGAKVSATILEIGKAKKIDVVKYKAKSRYYKRRGHRQPFVKVEIDAIS